MAEAPKRISYSELSPGEMVRALIEVAGELRTFSAVDLVARKRIDRCLSTIQIALHPVEVEPEQVTCQLCGAIYANATGSET